MRIVMISAAIRIRIRNSLLAAGLLCTAAAAAQAQTVTMEDLARKLDALQKQNEALEAKVKKLEAGQTSAAAAPAQAGPPAQQSAGTGTSPWSADPSDRPAPEEVSSTTIGSYGEIGYSRPTKQPEMANTSIGRAVLFVGHRFDEQTKMVAEFEWENAITSSGDNGEAEVEQLYVQHDFKNGLSGVAGLYLMPAGLVNEHHEPTAYYGVFRPDVDTMIIPSTWREVGLSLSGHTDIGLTWEVGVTTDQNLNNWDPADDEGRVRGPLQAIHQEGQFATTRDVAVHGSLNWRGPGSLLGASVFTGKLGQQQPGFLGNDSRLILWEVHGRYEIGGLDLAAEYARGTISNTEALNTSFLNMGLDNPTLVPSLFFGGYVQAGYRVWTDGYYKLIPFARYEILNTAAKFGNLTEADTGPRQPDEKIWTVGASFFIGEGVVLKADYRHYQTNPFPSA